MAHTTKHHDPRTQRCLETCLECERACAATVPHCLELGGRHAAPEHIALLLDCARICHTAAAFMMHDSPRHARVCAVCAEICEACARDCERLAGDDATMRECAEVCRRCATECREMAAA
jgi:hypothetical protein